MTVTANPGEPFTTILEDARTGILANLTVGIDNEDGSVNVAQSALGILAIDGPLGLYRRIPGLTAPMAEGLFYVVWMLDSVIYATEDLTVSATAEPDLHDISLRPGVFPPGSTVDVWDRSTIPGPHPPVARPVVTPYRSGVAVDNQGVIFLASLSPNTDYLVGATVDGQWRSVDFEVDR